jgi:hypothetical protein
VELPSVEDNVAWLLAEVVLGTAVVVLVLLGVEAVLRVDVVLGGLAVVVVLLGDVDVIEVVGVILVVTLALVVVVTIGVGMLGITRTATGGAWFEGNWYITVRTPSGVILESAPVPYSVTT